MRYAALVLSLVILAAAAQDRVFNGLDLLGYLIFTLALLRIILRKPVRRPHP
jgi:hypothetical protein